MLCCNCMREKGDAAVCPHCGCMRPPAAEAHQLPAGTVIGKRYTLGRVLGEGGFGITYIGLDNVLNARVAVKEYFPHGVTHRVSSASRTVSIVSGGTNSFFEKGKSRFLSEAQNIARFRNETGIVNVMDFVEENGTAYIVMEYLDGVDLRTYLRQHGRMSVEQTLTLLLPMIRSLGKIHAAGIIHRDISPDNIMVLKDGSVRLMDFGAARDYSDDNRSLSVVLKKGYAPEEQYRSNGKQGPWTDVYALCATIYRCITGKTPDESLDRLVEDELQRPSALGVAISPTVEEALMKGLAVRAKDRCQSMDELYRLLTASPQRRPVSPVQPVARSVVQPPQDQDNLTLAADLPVNTPSPVVSPAPAPKKKSTKPVVIAVIVALCFLVTALFILLLTPVKDAASSANSASSASSKTEPQYHYTVSLDDASNLLTSSEEDQLKSAMERVCKENNCNFVLFTTDDMNGASFAHDGTTKDYSCSYYDSVCGSDTDGVVVSLIMEDDTGSRCLSIYTCGKCIDQLSNSDNEAIRDDAIEYHSPDKKGYYEFFNAIIEGIGDNLDDTL